MSNDEIWLFECIRLEVGANPPKVLERTYAPRTEATLENARALLKSRYEDTDWPKRNGGLKPEAVRFLDGQNNEVLRYTVPQLLASENSRNA